MSKKKTEFTYLQMPLPEGIGGKRSVRVDWSGLNKRHIIDTGELSREENISTQNAPYLTPSAKRKKVFADISLEKPIKLCGFDDFLLCLCEVDGRVGAVRINKDGTYIKESFPTEDNYADDFESARSIVAMNVFEGENALTGRYIKKLIVFPDKVTMDFDGKDLNCAIIPDEEMPDIRYATVHLSRLYGVAGSGKGEPDRICVSGFNDYTNWNVDTDDDFSEAHAWVSAAQSDVRASGAFTGITTYLNSVVAFKNDYMHEIVGSSNPFRINDVFSEGAISNDSITEVDGALFFVSDDAVKVYTGGNPRIMSYKLGIDKFKYAASGEDGHGQLYLYCEDENDKKHLFVYNTLVGEWAEEAIDERVISFARNKTGFYMMSESGIYRIDTKDYEGQKWLAETDIGLGKSVDIKHISKVQLLCDIDAGSSLKVSLVYDEGSGGEREEVIFERKNSSKKIRAAIRIVPRKTAHWGARLRIEGVGYACIYQAEITVTSGGELYKTLESEWKDDV